MKKQLFLAFGLCFFSLINFAQTKTGLIFLDKETYNSIPVASLPTTEPSTTLKVDLSNRFPTPGFQGNIGSCVGWAASYLRAFNENWANNTSGNVFSPSFIYNQIRIGDCDGGSYITSALQLLIDQGCAHASEFPYTENCNIQPTPNIKNGAKQYLSQNYYRIQLSDLRMMKISLYSNFPVLIGINVDNAFKSYSGGVFKTWNDIGVGAHAMVIVGYDDEK